MKDTSRLTCSAVQRCRICISVIKVRRVSGKDLGSHHSALKIWHLTVYKVEGFTAALETMSPWASVICTIFYNV